jgi:hypothetical protein
LKGGTNLYSSIFNQEFPYYRQPQNDSYIRVFHASPDAPPVDVYANGKIVVKGLSYRGFTNYQKVSPGNYNIKVFPSGKVDNPVLDSSVYLAPGTITTLAAGGKLQDINLLAIPDPIKNLPPSKAYVRFGHLSPNAPNVDIALPDGKRLFKNVSYKQITDYLVVDPGTYSLQVIPTGTTKGVLLLPNLKLQPNKYYTVYAIGLVGDRPPLEALVPLDGNSYIKF